MFMGGDDNGRTSDEAGQAPESPDQVPPAPVPPPQAPPAPASPGFAPLGSVPAGSVPPGPVWQWAPPDEPRGPTVGGLIRGAIRLYRQAFSSLFGIALIQQAIQLVLWIPGLLIATRAVNRMIELFETTTFPKGGSYSQAAEFQERFQAQLQAAIVPDPGLAILSALTTGIGVPLAFIVLALFTAVGLATYAGRSDSVSDAARAVFARLTSFLVPGVLLGICVVIVSLPYGFNQTALSGSGRTLEGARLGVLLSGLSVVIAIVVVYFAIRWSLAIPAMLAEGIGVRAGLRRSSELSQGMRLRIFGAIILVGLAVVVVELVGLVIALVIGFGTGSIAIGVATGVVLLLGLLVAAVPVYPLMTVVAYRDRVPAQPETTDPQP
jgi:hypothetical protein